ncbi:MAG: carboxypeptidase-like regulatory domain-containing protein [Roseivirga sp.]|nr:carboxypeptidase-like regulatory domain-containing protein [Roseivirga sp.]
MRFLIAILLLTVAVSIHAQVVRGVVKDKTNQMPIAYLSVGVVGTPIGTLTDRSGKFELTIPDSLRSARLTLYGLGYNRQDLSISTFRGKELEISMEPLTSKLTDYVVNRKESGGYEINEYLTSKRKLLERAYRSFSPKNPEHSGTVVASRIAIDVPHFIISASIFIAESNTDTTKFRLRLYNVDKATGLPGDDLIQKPVLRNFTQKKGWMEIDLEDEYIFLEKGEYFLGFELIEKKEDRFRVYDVLKQRREKLKSLYEQGVKGVDQVSMEINGETQLRYRTSFSAKKIKKYGLNMPMFNTKFEVVGGSESGFYRSSSLENWIQSELGVFRMKLKYEYEKE